MPNITPEPVKHQPPSVLIVEDDAPLRAALERFFQTNGYEHRAAANGVEAVEALKAKVPDVMLLDVRMPKMDGLGVLAELRRTGADVAVIMLTANEDLGVAKSCLELGARDYLTKPVNLDTLEKAVQWQLAARWGRPRREPIGWSLSKLWS